MIEVLIIGKKQGSMSMQAMWQGHLPEKVEWAEDYSSNRKYTNRKIIFLLDLNTLGYDLTVITHLTELREKNGPMALQGSTAVIMANSPTELYTKRAGQNIAFCANQMGCRFPGHSLVEATQDLKNFCTWQKQTEDSLEQIRDKHCKKLIQRLVTYVPPKIENPSILALHASSKETSNTLMLWNAISKHLKGTHVQTKHIENGSVVDCKGCDYKTCIHYAHQKSCFYGGLVVKDLLSSIEEADIIVWISPNYNDALSAMHTALINRLTVLYRRVPLYSKRVYGIIVSGNSGSDSVACQLLSALNFNKGFDVPPNFALMMTANDPGSVLKIPDFNKKTQEYAKQILGEIMV